MSGRMHKPNICDPYRTESHEAPTPDAVAAGVIAHPELLREIFRRLSWVDRDQLEALRDEIDAMLKRRQDIEAACREGHFGRDYIARGR